MHSVKIAFSQASSLLTAPLLVIVLLIMEPLRWYLTRKKFKPVPPSPFIYTMQ